MVEEWSKWKPEKLEVLPAATYLKRLTRDDDILLISFETEEEGKLVNVTFNKFVFSYRSTDEGNRLKLLVDLNIKYGEDFYKDWRFFKIKNSPYIRWLHEENCGIYREEEIYHFVFITNMELIEVLATYDPEVKIVELHSEIEK